jgi:5-formyltetrahydrofolate cyclo-ligase
MTVADQKKALREHTFAARARLAGEAPDAARCMAENFLNLVPLVPDAVVSAYVAIGDEADPSPLIEALRARGHEIALPRVVGKGRRLVFHLCEAGARLVPGVFGLSQPAPDWPEIEPDVLVVPLLAFDGEGNRLGYGAGFYDRTLADLRARHGILAAGYALSGQEVAHVPHDDSDERLDWIVTERYAKKFER